MTRTWLAVTLLCMCASVAHAEDKVATAKRLFEEGRALAQSGDQDRACARFSRSLQLDPSSIGTQLNVADCLERQGKLVRAHALFDQAAREADPRAKYAANRAAVIAKKLPLLVIQLPSPVPDDVAITLDGEAITVSGGVIQQHVDPGVVEVRVTAAGVKPYRKRVATVVGETATVEVAFRTGGSTSPSAPEEPEPRRDPSRVRLSIWLSIGGGVGLFAAGVLGLAAQRKYDGTVEMHCMRTTELLCTQPGLDGIDDAQNLGNAATAFAIVGGVALVGGVFVYLTAPKERRSIAIAPAVTPQSVGIAVGGAF